MLMDRDERAHLDGWAKALNVVYILVGSAVGVATGWIVWKETSKVLEAIESEQQQQQQQEESEQGRRRASRLGRGHDGDAREDAAGEASPFVLDFDGDEEEEGEEVEEQVGKGSERSNGGKAEQSLLPR